MNILQLIVIFIGLAGLQLQYQMHEDRQESDEYYKMVGDSYFEEMDPNYNCKRKLRLLTKGQLLHTRVGCKSNDEIKGERDGQ